jgi:restriction endonuclease NotI
MVKRQPKGQQTQYRFGIGEWYGKSFAHLSPEEHKRYAELQFSGGRQSIPLCPFLSREENGVPCSKKGGVCSLRSYERSGSDREVALDRRASTIRTICPIRFEEDNEIYRWIGEVILGDPSAVTLGQVNFLERVPLIGDPIGEESRTAREVGRIDNILVVPDTKPLQWCAVEIQAVYFSGPNMRSHFEEIRNHKGPGLPFPKGTRRPDYRSSAPKRLMPQLQIKVPTLSRWGKKMAVVIDEDFFSAMGRMEAESDLSNCDVAWFVVGYKDEKDAIHLQRRKVVFTTLENSVDGLIAGRPPAQAKFEEKIRARLQAPSKI